MLELYPGGICIAPDCVGEDRRRSRPASACRLCAIRWSGRIAVLGGPARRTGTTGSTGTTGRSSGSGLGIVTFALFFHPPSPSPSSFSLSLLRISLPPVNPGFLFPSSHFITPCSRNQAHHHHLITPILLLYHSVSIGALKTPPSTSPTTTTATVLVFHLPLLYWNTSINPPGLVSLSRPILFPSLLRK